MHYTLSPPMARLLFACYLALLLPLLALQTCNCEDTTLCAPSSCGNHTISYPFRLNSGPSNCGNPLYTLHCEKNTSTVLCLDSRKHYVQAINNNNLTIRLVDAGVKLNDCSSLPSFTLTYANLDNSMNPYTSFQYKKSGPKWDPEFKRLSLSKKIIFINCANPVNSPLYVDTGTGLNGAKSYNASLSTHSYVNIGGMKASDLMELCSLERMTLLPAKDYKNMSFKEIHSQLAYGFELSWHNSRCGSCAYGFECYIDDSYNTHCGVSHWLWEAIGKLTYLALQYQGTKFIFGSLFVIAFLIYKWRRRHLSAYDTVEEFLQTHNNLMPVIRYSYSKIKKMTGGFKEKLGE